MRLLFTLTIVMFLFISCRDNSPEEATVGNGRLYTINHGIFRTRVAMDDWNTMKYGFDAVSDNGNAYISIEAGNHTNTFLLLAAPNSIGLYSVQTDNSNVSLTRSASFVMPDPSNPAVDISAVRYTVTSSTNVGSVKLKICRSMCDPNCRLLDLETLEKEDVIYWGYSSYPDAFKNPLTLDAKVYNNTTLPDVYVYKLYGTTVDVTDFKTYLNRISAQAVASVVNAPVATSTITAKTWDLNGNGKLDIWPDLLKSGTPNANDEFIAIIPWAGPNGQNFWNDSKNGIIILDQEFINRETSETIVGITTDNGKFTVIAGGSSKKTAAHEYFHMLRTTKHLYDIIDDEYNLMYYLGDWTSYEILRYREFTKEGGGKQNQWASLSGVTF